MSFINEIQKCISENISTSSQNIVEQSPLQKSVPNANETRKVFSSISSKFLSDIEEDKELKEALKVLPSNYNFEIHKTIWRVCKAGAKHVVLQFPEGLMIFSTVIADILEAWTGALITIMGDVTYGACCVDDFTAKELGADFMVHYGHSCLVPIDQIKSIPCLYVFVDIQFDITHLQDTIEKCFPVTKPLALVSIIQFVSSLQKLAQDLKKKGYTVAVPQCHPLSPGEVLGCTSIPIPEGHTIIGLGDGRFHLESIMISNPGVETYLYNPYSKILSQEEYDQSKMKSIRKSEIDKVAKASTMGVILGTLGRQGSLKVLNNLETQILSSGKDYAVFLMSEIFPQTLKEIKEIQSWVQIACPRLSIDWGASFSVPLLNPYEASVALQNAKWHKDTYPMDFYAYSSQGEWTPNHRTPCPGNCTLDGARGCREHRTRRKP